MNLIAESPPKKRRQSPGSIIDILPPDPPIYDISEGKPVTRIAVPAPPSHPVKDRLLYVGVSAIIWIFCPLMMIVTIVLIARALSS